MLKDVSLVNCGGLLSDSVDYTTSCYAYDGNEWGDFPSLPSDAKVCALFNQPLTKLDFLLYVCSLLPMDL